jgi:hypothetical protein
VVNKSPLEWQYAENLRAARNLVWWASWETKGLSIITLDRDVTVVLLALYLYPLPASTENGDRHPFDICWTPVLKSL